MTKGMTSSATLEPFRYSPLDPSIDSIRLVHILPAPNFHDPIHCRLSHVTFAQKPRYEALSYTWGSENHQKKIILDGHDFGVTYNLFDALRYLRDTQVERGIWIDAISIQQEDIPERNKQLSIMPIIYERARVVLVWLGHTSASSVSNENTWDNPDILDSICKNHYWGRVWIVQEIGVARRVWLQVNKDKVEWSTFIAMLKKSGNFDNSVPVKLQTQLEDKYNEGHKLRNLLESHQDSLCREARDKIYGFVGLASDCYDGFPMDYRKSLFEVWKDTVIFKNRDRSEYQYDILKFGRLVRRLLGGRDIVTAGEVEADISSRKASTAAPKLLLNSSGEINGPPEILMVPVLLAGRIIYIGPTYRDIIADVQSIPRWRAKINQYLPDQKASAHEENDYFLEALEEAEDFQLEAVSDFNHDISWNFAKRQHIIEDAEYRIPIPDSDSSATHNRTEMDSSTGPRLFLLGGGTSYQFSSGKMGLVPPSARVGDFICRVNGIQKAVILRKANGVLKVVGTAIMAENSYKAREAKEKYRTIRPDFQTPEFEVLDTNKLSIYIDVAIAYQLLG
ncbi:hypothetical protein B7494_g6324 [Chlorociboria aeruginascens]|nr:hypothetical protein B7494_g6324 [Chlorociboria aeruginascens]